MQLRLSQRHLPLTFSWKAMAAVWTECEKSWLWVQIHPQCCPECNVTHSSLESNVLLRAPFPSTTSSSPPKHLLLHSFHLSLETCSQARFHQCFLERGAANLVVTLCMSQSYTTIPFLQPHLVAAVVRGPEQPKSSPGPTPWLSPFGRAVGC